MEGEVEGFQRQAADDGEGRRARTVCLRAWRKTKTRPSRTVHTGTGNGVPSVVQDVCILLEGL